MSSRDRPMILQPCRGFTIPETKPASHTLYASTTDQHSDDAVNLVGSKKKGGQPRYSLSIPCGLLALYVR